MRASGANDCSLRVRSATPIPISFDALSEDPIQLRRSVLCNCPALMVNGKRERHTWEDGCGHMQSNTLSVKEKPMHERLQRPPVPVHRARLCRKSLGFRHVPQPRFTLFQNPKHACMAKQFCDAEITLKEYEVSCHGSDMIPATYFERRRPDEFWCEERGASSRYTWDHILCRAQSNGIPESYQSYLVTLLKVI